VCKKTVVVYVFTFDQPIQTLTEDEIGFFILFLFCFILLKLDIGQKTDESEGKNHIFY